MLQFDTETLGKLLLEREVRPALVVDLETRVLEANRATRALTGTESTPPPGRLRDWLKVGSRECFDNAWRRALGGDRVRVTAGLELAPLSFEPIFELSPLRVGGKVVGVLMVMVDAAAPGPVVPLVPATGLHYEVSLDEAGHVGKLVRVLTGEQKASAECGQPCWASLHQRQTPCERCPLEGEVKDRTVVRLASTQPFAAQLLVGKRTRDDLATVSTFTIDDTTWSALVRQRVEAMAVRAKLSARERSVLELLMMGRSLSDIAAEVGITERTTKYHQQNLLKKLGADSRADLLRLFS